MAPGGHGRRCRPVAEVRAASGGIRVSVAGEPMDPPASIVLELVDGAVIADGAAVAAVLERADSERAVLRDSGGGEAHRVLFLPVSTGAGTRSRDAARTEVVVDGWRFEVEIESAARAALRERARRGRADAGQSGPTQVHAIIPGVVVSVSVAPGDAVVAGQQLLVVEAMKMQNELRAPREGVIEQVAVGPGSTIDVGDVLLVIT